MSGIKVLFCAYQTESGANGGMESATQIFEAMADSVQWTLVTNRNTERTERWRSNGADVVRFAFNEHEPYLLRIMRLGWTSAQLVKLAANADILHGNDIRAAQMLVPAAQIVRKPLVFTIRDTKPDADRYGLQWKLVVRQLDAMVTLSNDMKYRVQQRLPVRQECIEVIDSIVDLRSFRPAKERLGLRRRLGIQDDEFALGMVAGVNDKKRQLDVICKVLPRLLDLPIRLHLIGDFCPDKDEYARTCIAAVNELGLSDRVLFHGYRPDVADWCAALDVVLIASRREGLARCMIEAMASGTPVVSMDVASARETLVETRSGLVVGLEDWPALAESVATLALDPDLRKELGQAGRKTAELRFSADQAAAKWSRLYRGLAGEGLSGK